MKKTFLEANKRAKPRRVDFGLYNDDFQCALLGSLGFSSSMIESKTGLTSGRISYRLRKISIKRMEYRNGESTMAKMVLRNMKPTVERELRSYLKENNK
jgi:hypothetical protein